MRSEVCGAGRRERAWGSGSTSGAHAEIDRLECSVGHARAHVEHGAHVRDAGRVEAQRLVEGLRVLPSRKQSLCDAGRGVRAGRRGS